MNKIQKYFLILFCCFLFTNCTKNIQTVKNNETHIKKIAILPVVSDGTVEKKYADIARDYIEVEFTSYEEYNVVDRINIDKLINELKLSLVGLTKEQTKEIGTFLNADYILVSKIYLSNKTFILTGRVIEVSTSKIIKTSVGKVSSSDFIDGAAKGLARRLTNRM